ncbi:MAG: response regulator [Bdellovibrionota bacterium]
MNLNGWVYHTNIILLKTGKIERTFSKAVSSLRGFVLTEKKEFIEPYYESKDIYQELLKELESKVSDNVMQTRRAVEIKKQYDNWVSFAEKTLEIQRKNGKRAATDHILEGQGKKIVDTLYVQFGEFRDAEESLRNKRVYSQHRFARIAMGVAIVLSLLFGILIAVYGRRQLLGLSTSYEDILELQVKQNETLKIQNWMKSGQAELGIVMTSDMLLKDLSEKILQYVAQFVKAKIGVMYIANDHQVFEIKSTYAHAQETFPLKSFKIGETLLGQVAREGEIVQTKDLPPEYFKITSGVGEMSPKHVVIVPISYNKQVNSLIELGFIDDVNPQSLEWLNQVGESIGTAIKTAKYKDHLEVLLEEVQNQAEELQSQQEELRVNNEELEEQTKILKETQSHLESQHAELEQTNSQLEEQTQALENQADILNEKNQQLNLAQEDLKKKAEELKKSSQYKSEFLANMSHELRTPLNSSLILAKLLADNKDKNLTGQQVEYAEQILNSSNDLLHLINDILDLSKVEAGKLEVSADNIPLKKFTSNLEKMFLPLAKEKNLNFAIDISNDTPQEIFTDSLRLEQVLKNLLSNAIKFTKKGSVTLTISKSKDYSSFLDFSVVDTGIGIDSDKLEVIFEAFKQADGTTNRMYGGTGLGLSISRNLAYLLGGKISVKSVKGKGSTFTVFIPQKLNDIGKQDAISRDLPTQPESKPVVEEVRKPFVVDDRDKITENSNVVLIVEDDPKFARILYGMAKASNFESIITDHASDALELALTIKPQAILLDVKLPDHSGLIVLDQLKHNVSTKHIPVHIISGMDFVKDALEMGAVGYAIKPAGDEELKKVFSLLKEKILETTQKVLIVEDDKTQRMAIRHLIRNNKVQTVAVGSGTEALEALTKEEYSCMIVDLNLPDMTGFELLEKISETKLGGNLPVIVYTGRDLSMTEEDRLRKYSKSVIVKGAKSPERLLSEVTLFLHQVETELDPDRQKVLEELRSREKIFESKKILIVDDDMRNVFALTAAFEQKGAKIVVAKNGQESLKRLQEDTVDIVLMDIMMGIMDGYKAIQEIRKQKKFAKLPIIALTAKAMKDDRELCLNAGANDYLTKPIDIEKLLSLVRVWISHSGRV